MACLATTERVSRQGINLPKRLSTQCPLMEHFKHLVFTKFYLLLEAAEKVLLINEFFSFFLYANLFPSHYFCSNIQWVGVLDKAWGEKSSILGV